MRSLLFYTKSLPFFFCCYRHWNRSSIIVRYLITTASKQAHVKLLERKHLFPDGSLFVPSFMVFSHRNIKYCPNVALMGITPAFWISFVWKSEVGFLSDIPSLLTSLLIVWTPKLIKLKYIIYVCRIALFVGLFSFGVVFFCLFGFGPFCVVCSFCTLFSFTCCSLWWRYSLEGLCLGGVQSFPYIQAYKLLKLCAWS